MNNLLVKGIQCAEPKCKEIFRNKTRLYYHQKNKHPLSIYNINCSSICQICEKVFNTPQLRNDHFRRLHSSKGRLSQVCSQCGKTFKNKDSLRNHKFRVHVKKQIKCDKCGKSFAKKLSLVEHKCFVYKCKWCSKVYSRGDSLSKHIKNYHTYCCIYCNINNTEKVLYDFDKLIIHCKRVHNK